MVPAAPFPFSPLLAVVAVALVPGHAVALPGGDILVALWPGTAGERLVAAHGGRLVSKPLRIWTVTVKAAAQVVPDLRRLGLLRYQEPDRVEELAGGDGLGPTRRGRVVPRQDRGDQRDPARARRSR